MDVRAGGEPHKNLSLGEVRCRRGSKGAESVAESAHFTDLLTRTSGLAAAGRHVRPPEHTSTDVNPPSIWVRLDQISIWGHSVVLETFYFKRKKKKKKGTNYDFLVIFWM